eukprot:CAMPEP_0113445372 /NCGR_PEP_ID=MMETSP0014_2-20120614/3152_1 /TAXON_ID=2857 /ORGANISM="Nitzschia sp." /LENGTH=318 /DNA_ID=CAMNT_0000336421 /DNA_START=262 /DNA_END=1214 /DNA_ORIENTATION=- /assembly_acc=CAM_ASM_000159
MNSSYNVGIPQQRRLTDELIRAANIMGNRDSKWSQVMRPSNFFTRFAHFLQLTVRASNGDDFLKWFRLCESRLRILISSVDSQQVSVWPFAHWFRREASEAGVVPDGGSIASEDDCQHEAFLFIGLKFSAGVESVDLKQCTSEFLYSINSWEGRNDGMDFLLDTILREDLPMEMIDRDLLPNEGQVISPKQPESGHTPAPIWYVPETKEDSSDSSSVRTSSTSNSTSSFDPSQSNFNDGEAGDDNDSENDDDRFAEDGHKNIDHLEDLSSTECSADQVPARTKITPKLARSCIGDDELIMMSPTKRLRPSVEKIPVSS